MYENLSLIVLRITCFWFSIISNISGGDGMRPVLNFDQTGTSSPFSAKTYAFH